MRVWVYRAVVLNILLGSCVIDRRWLMRPLYIHSRVVEGILKKQNKKKQKIDNNNNENLTVNYRKNFFH